MEKMNIIDLNGEQIAVTDLDLAIMQADDYRHYRISNPTICHLRLQSYWEHFYQKLVLLVDEIKE